MSNMPNRLPTRFLTKKIRERVLQMCPGAITHVETREPVAALTFDDGPHPVYTPRLLSILKKHGVSATFFMVGMTARRYPDIVKMVARAGHVIGNHSWDHAHLNQIKFRRRRLKQMWACARATAPYSKGFFRPPFGAHNNQIRFDALLFRYKIILWSVSAQDWLPQGAEDIATKIINRVTPGSIFLLHDASCSSKVPDPQSDRQPMLDGLQMALAEIKRQIQFVTIPELLRYGRPLSNWPRSSDKDK